MKYFINVNGTDFGIYEGVDEWAALAQMCKEAGYEGFAASRDCISIERRSSGLLITVRDDEQFDEYYIAKA